MKKTKIMFCFDTEDITTVDSTESAARFSDILSEEGIRGSFMTVGRVAQEIVRSKRFDLIDRLKRHEINFHTKDHTIHPTLIEYTDLEDFNKAAGHMLKEECEGLGMINAVFSQDGVYSVCPPGPSHSYVSMVIYRELGIPVYSDSILLPEDGRDIFFCNALHLDYTVQFETDVFDKRKSFDETVADLKEKLAKREKAIIYDHPNRALCDQFWDAVNYNKVNKCEYGKWIPCHRRSDSDIEDYYNLFRALVRELKADGRFEFTTPGEYWESIKDKQDRKIEVSHIPMIKKALEEDFASVSEPCSLSLSEIFDAARCFLAGATEYVPQRVYGFLSAPVGITEPVRVTAEGVRNAASKICRPTREPFFLPPTVEVDGQVLGAADFLFAMLEVLCGAETVELKPRPQMNSLDEFPALRDVKFKGIWLYSTDLEDAYLSDRLRLQSWTLRD